MKRGEKWTSKNNVFPETFFKKDMKRMSTIFSHRFSETPIYIYMDFRIWNSVYIYKQCIYTYIHTFVCLGVLHSNIVMNNYLSIEPFLFSKLQRVWNDCDVHGMVGSHRESSCPVRGSQNSSVNICMYIYILKKNNRSLYIYMRNKFWLYIYISHSSTDE